MKSKFLCRIEIKNAGSYSDISNLLRNRLITFDLWYHSPFHIGKESKYIIHSRNSMLGIDHKNGNGLKDGAKGSVSLK